MKNIIIGSRGSDLALWQANHVKSRLEALGVKIEIKIIKTQGDQIQNLSFDKLEGKGFFTKEIEEALINGEIDIAVHSHKDLPTTSPIGLIIAAVSEREDPSELLLIDKNAVDKAAHFQLKNHGVLGTSSARRKSQFLAFRPDIQIEDLRGNVPTRIQKLRDGKYDAILLAKAGVERLQLDLSDFHVVTLNPDEFVPAPAQGVLGIQIREKDQDLYELLQNIHQQDVAQRIGLERKVLNLLDGGCQLPLGTYCTEKNGQLNLKVSKSKAWNDFPVRLNFTFPKNIDIEQGAKQVIDHLTHLQPKNVFITKDLEEGSFLVRGLTENNFKVTYQTLIRILPVPFENVPQTNWIFFNSKNGVNHFFSREPKISAEVKFAAIGPATANAVVQHGYDVSFIGEGDDTIEIGKQFAQKINKESVLFPQAAYSTGNAFNQVKDIAHAEQITVYKTDVLNNIEIPEVQIVVVTSPSNAEAFFANYSKDLSEIDFVAIGKSTATKISELGGKKIHTSTAPADYALLESIFSI